MTRFLLAGAAMFGLIAGSAMAQTATTTTTNTKSAIPITPPSAPGTMTTSSTQGQMLHSDGDRSVTVGAGSSNDRGTSNDVIVTTKTYPFSNLVTTEKKSVSVSNGVKTQTLGTTQTYPPMPGFAGSSTTTEKTETVK
jgi:hypothetical protein